MKNSSLTANIPMKIIGPIVCQGPYLSGNISVPLATFETPLWPSTQRGALVSELCGGITCSLIDDGMTRSFALEALSGLDAIIIKNKIFAMEVEIAEQIKNSGRFVSLKQLHIEVLANKLFLRLKMLTGEAAGHNMVTKAAQAVQEFLLSRFQNLRYISISANLCVDKKVSAINGILGRGKSVMAEIIISAAICKKILRTNPKKIVELNQVKNWQGSLLAGSLRSANAHYANILLAIYLATGQDAANLIEGSQGFTIAECRNYDNDLYFAVNLPNVIVGTIGNGKNLEFVQKNLDLMGCLDKTCMPNSNNSQRLALIIAATVLCGELSLMAALTNPGELVKSHLKIERNTI